MIELKEVGFGYTDTRVLTGIDLSFGEGECIGIIGPNGCGKTTLLSLMRGALIPDVGTVQFEGEDPASMSRAHVARRLAVVSQSPSVLFPYTVRETVEMGLFARRSFWSGPDASDRRETERAIELADVADIVDRRVTELSGGELQRVMLARALAQNTSILLLDEATTHLDLDHTLELAKRIVQLNRGEGRTIVQISHDLSFAAETSSRLVLISREGRVFADGAPAEVITPENLRAVYNVDVVVDVNPRTGNPMVVMDAVG